jgi:hypothetical protein
MMFAWRWWTIYFHIQLWALAAWEGGIFAVESDNTGCLLVLSFVIILFGVSDELPAISLHISNFRGRGRMTLTCSDAGKLWWIPITGISALGVGALFPLPPGRGGWVYVYDIDTIIVIVRRHHCNWMILCCFIQ